MNSNVVKLLRQNNLEGIDQFYGDYFQVEMLKKMDSMNELLQQQVASNSQQNKIVYVNSNDNKVITERTIVVANLKKTILKLEENYEDICERLEYFCMIKDNLKRLKNAVNKNSDKYYYRTSIILHDSILHLKSESVTISQVEAIKYLISKLDNFNIDKEEFNEIDDILVENNLDWIPECE